MARRTSRWRGHTLAAFAIVATLAQGSASMASDAATLKVSMPWGASDTNSANSGTRLLLSVGGSGNVVEKAGLAQDSAQTVVVDLTQLAETYATARSLAAADGNGSSSGHKLLIGAGIAAVVFVGAFVYVTTHFDEAAKRTAESGPGSADDNDDSNEPSTPLVPGLPLQ